MKYFLLSIIFGILFNNSLSAKNKDSNSLLCSNIFAKVDSSIKTISSLDYDMLFYQANPLLEDTNVMSVKVLLKYKAKESLGTWHKLQVNIESKKEGFIGNTEIKYDGKWYFRNWTDATKKTFTNPLIAVRGDENNVFGGSYSGMFIPNYFREKDFFISYIKKNNVANCNIKEDIYNGIPIYKVSYDVIDDTYSDMKEIYYFNKSNYLPIAFFGWFNIGVLTYYYEHHIDYNHINQEINDRVFTIDPKEVVPTIEEATTIPTKELVKVGSIAPEFESNLNNNTNIKLSDLRGKIVILDFWYVSCPPCLMAIPTLVEIDEKYRDKDVVVLGINPYNISKHINGVFDKKGVKYLSTVKSEEISKQYGVISYPTTIVIDKQGKIKKVKEGWDEDLKKDLENILENLLKK